MKKQLLLLILIFSFSSFLLKGQTVYVTNTGEKYHTSGCRYLSKSKIAIELKDALNQSYVACKVCRPTQTVKADNKEKVKQEEVPAKNATSHQCSATTKAGSRCKRITTSSNGKCWQHGGN